MREGEKEIISLRVSIIIPVRNDAEGLTSTIASLLNQDYSPDQYEIIVVDNGSSDMTWNRARQLQNAYPKKIRAFQETGRRSSYQARNRGIDEAKGEILAFVDANITLDHRWLASAVSCLESKEIDYLACRIILPRPEGKESLISKYSRLRDFPVREYLTKHRFAVTGCLLVRRRVFDTAGMFDERMVSSGDREFGDRIFHMKIPAGYCPEAAAYHLPRTTFRSIAAKSLRIGRGLMQLRKYHPERFGSVWGGLFNVRALLPPHLGRFTARMKNWEALPVMEKILFFCLQWMMKWIAQAGSIVELCGGSK